MKSISSIFVWFLMSAAVFAQPITESGQHTTPRDGVFDKKITKERRTLPRHHIREADVLWSKRVWREIDVRQKINQSFTYPESPFISVLMEAIINGDLEAYGAMDDSFTERLSQSDKQDMLGSTDTIGVWDPVTQNVRQEIVRNELTPNDIKRFRLKEDWIFNTNTGRMEVYIIGIAPICQQFDDQGNVLFEYPLCWIYFPEARPLLDHKAAFNPLTGGMGGQSNMTWGDIFENRLFASHITKSTNVYDRRIQDYKSGIDALHEAEKIKSEIFAFEQDVWSY